VPIYGREGEPIEGVYAIQRVTFHNEETGYAVVTLIKADQAAGPGIPAVGLFGDPGAGACYRIAGTWRRDPKYGMQVKVSSAEPEAPRSVAAIERYLSGSAIKGLGPHYARALVKYFGAETYAELQAGGPHLQDVPGIGPVRAGLIREGWAEHQGVHDLMINLQGAAGLTPRQAQAIYRQYGREAWLVIQRDPFRLAEDVRGFGFKTCDRIAAKLGLAHDAPERIQAGIVHLLREALDEGHLWCAPADLAEAGRELLDVPAEAVSAQIAPLIQQERIVREILPAAKSGGKSDRWGAWSESPAAEAGRLRLPSRPSSAGDIQNDTSLAREGGLCNHSLPASAAGMKSGGDADIVALYLPDVARAERRIAERLEALLRYPTRGAPRLPLAQAEQLVARVGSGALTDEQRSAALSVLTGARLTILTGGPGTGKTTTMRSLLAGLEALHVSYALCATTGRAAKQLAASTGRPAATVHRHLGLGIEQREHEPVRETVLIIDESSMLDLWLFDQILARLAAETRLVLVGDVDQLPSVGPGAILQDLIALGEGRGEGKPGLKVTRLTRIFRQEAGERSMIVVNCHRVRQGQRPEAAAPQGSDYYEMIRETPQEARELAVSLAATRLPRYLNVPPTEVQVLAPMHSGEAGIRALNQALQAALNPPAPGKVEIAWREHGEEQGLMLREGDKVRQTRNDYKKQVFNGDLGIVTRILPEEQALSVQYDDRLVGYTFDELDALTHSWAMTVHAAQGSQWPAVVIIMLKNHYVMLERNILYTALSRAQRLAVLITQEQAVRLAVAQARSTQRRTGLVARMEKGMGYGV